MSPYDPREYTLHVDWSAHTTHQDRLFEGQTGVYVIEYTNEGGDRSLRVVEPLGAFRRSGRSYVWAYCHKRECAIAFRADRVGGVLPATGFEPTIDAKGRVRLLREAPSWVVEAMIYPMFRGPR